MFTSSLLLVLERRVLGSRAHRRVIKWVVWQVQCCAMLSKLECSGAWRWWYKTELEGTRRRQGAGGRCGSTVPTAAARGSCRRCPHAVLPCMFCMYQIAASTRRMGSSALISDVRVLLLATAPVAAARTGFAALTGAPPCR